MGNRKFHFTGADDLVMQELAQALQRAGDQVTSSGPSWAPDKVTADLNALIISPSVTRDNPELRKAQELKVPVYSYPEFFRQLCRNKHRVVVAGSSGKTMITLLILHVLNHHNRKFDYLLARQVPGVEHSIRLSDAPIVIIEGQDGPCSVLDPTTRFLKYQHHIGLISGIEWQESAAYPTKADYTKQFSQFETSTPKGGVLIYFDLEPVITALGKVNQPDVLYIPYKTHASVYDGGQEYLAESSSERHPFKLTGKHNLQNISAAKETVKKLGITPSMFYEAVQHFGGKSI